MPDQRQKLLERAGRMLFGDQWQSAMADARGCDRRSIARYADGARTAPDDLGLWLSLACAKRRAELADLEADIRRRWR